MIDDLRRRLQDANDANADLTIERDTLVIEVAELREQVARQAAEIDQLVGQLSSVTGERDELLARNSELELLVSETSDVNILIVEEADALRSDLTSLRIALDDARLALGEERVNSRKLSEQVDRARSSFLVLLAECFGEEGVGELVDAEFEALSDVAVRCISDFRSQSAQMSQLEQTVADLTQERDGLLLVLDGQQPSYDVLRARVEELCAGYENADEMVEMYMGNAEAMQQIEPMVVEQQAIDWIVEHGKKKTKKVSFKDYMNAPSS